MKRYRNLDDIPDSLRGGAVTVGNFDGVHRGHARLIKRALSLAAEVKGPSVAFTFDPHPAVLLRPDAAPSPLIWTERKLQIFESFGLDAAVVYPVDREFLNTEPRKFFDDVLRDKLQVRAMVEGANFFFGRNRSGNVELLGKLCEQNEVRFEVASAVEVAGQVVSSSRVRQLVREGRLDLAAQALGRPYRIRGMVVHGAGRGAKLGFPTANVDQIEVLLPPPGIYAGHAFYDGGSRPAAISLGTNPTFGDGFVKVEVHLLDFDGDLYDRPLEVDFHGRLRDMLKFDSVEELLRQMTLDVAAARTIDADARRREDSTSSKNLTAHFSAKCEDKKEKSES